MIEYSFAKSIYGVNSFQILLNIALISLFTVYWVEYCFSFQRKYVSDGIELI